MTGGGGEGFSNLSAAKLTIFTGNILSGNGTDLCSCGSFRDLSANTFSTGGQFRACVVERDTVGPIAPKAYSKTASSPTTCPPGESSILDLQAGWGRLHSFAIPLKVNHADSAALQRLPWDAPFGMHASMKLLKLRRSAWPLFCF